MSSYNRVAFSSGIVPWHHLPAWKSSSGLLDRRAWYNRSGCNEHHKHIKNRRPLKYGSCRVFMSGGDNGTKNANVNGYARIEKRESEYGQGKELYEFTKQAMESGKMSEGNGTNNSSSDILGKNLNYNDGTDSSQSLTDLESDYKLAKARYKEAKAIAEKGVSRKVGEFTNVGETVSKEMVAVLEEEYRAKKGAYKRLKEMRKSKEKTKEKPKEMEMLKQEDSIKVMTDSGLCDNGQSLTSDNTANNTEMITVCGSKTCCRLGAQAVATLLGPSAILVPKCMKRCGGVGPSVRLTNGKVVKVDFKNAVRNAVPRNSVPITQASYTVRSV